ncbi:hypothetical protein MMC34_007051 [Xylographa carneopallida]|nr:hypothetical protein [Xylographa carneopallida]
MASDLEYLMASIQALVELRSYYMDSEGPDHIAPALGVVIAVVLARMPAHPVAHIVLDNHWNKTLVDHPGGLDETASAAPADTFRKGLAVVEAVVGDKRVCYAAVAEGGIVAGCSARDIVQNLIRYAVAGVDMEPAVDHMVLRDSNHRTDLMMDWYMVVGLARMLEGAAAHDLHTVDSGRIADAADVVDAVGAVSVLVLDMVQSSDHIVHFVVQADKLLEEHCQCNRRLLIVVHLTNSHSYCSGS